MTFLTEFLIGLLTPLIEKAVAAAFAQFQAYQDARWKDELSKIVDQLNKPTTVEEKQNAAKALSDLISRL